MINVLVTVEPDCLKYVLHNTCARCEHKRMAEHMEVEKVLLKLYASLLRFSDMIYILTNIMFKLLLLLKVPWVVLKSQVLYSIFPLGWK